ncbi:V-type ATP synthase subunit I [Amphibacillus sp. Q70]|uniref:V-type ATP synthase subunit I n=1 Tax=Amphibacillus sp. Q70 TaxID=3453416 RepID=UPI003F87E30E
MAIAKMKKLTLISFHEQKDQLLQSIQALQKFEVVDLPSTDLGDYEGSPRQVDELETLIKNYQTRIEQVQATLSFLQPHLPKTALLKKLREKPKELSLHDLAKEMTKFSAEDLVENLLSKESELKTIAERQKDLKEEEAFLSSWKRLNFSQADVQSLKKITGSVGTVPQHVQNEYMNQLNNHELIFVEEVYQNRDEHGVIVFYDIEHEDVVKPLLNEWHFDDLTANFTEKPSELLKKIEKEQKELQKQVTEINAQLKKMQDEEWQLMLAEEYYQAKLDRERSKLFLVDEKHLFIMEGWLEESRLSSFKTALKATLEEQEYSLLVEDIKEEDYERVPVVLTNNDYIAPFENVTEMYSLPKYNEIDPTPFLAPFYAFFFGMMGADLGYGLILWIATFGALKFLNFNPSMKKSLKFFHLLSYPTMLWGLIYGSFFGTELPFVLLSTTDDVITILILSVIFGVVQIFLGLGIKSHLMLKYNDKYGSVSDGFGWIAIFTGLIVLLLGNMIFESDILTQAGIIIAVSGALAIILASVLASENKGLGVGLGLYNLYNITGYIGDIVSYTRLMAIGVSGGSIALAFNMIIGFIPPVGRFTIGILLFVALHAVNIGLTMLSAYVHGARLIFVEFFGKFYEGGGKALKPLKASEKYIQLKNQNE